ncbi:MAG: CDP-alcohol phosphatidyltransferase family protein [Gammaproteobacteria bacterium]
MNSLLTLPNALSVARGLLAAPLAWALATDCARLGVPLFALAVASDLLDGRLARARGTTSRLGTLLDHGADACLVTALTATAAWHGLVPPLLPLLIASAFLQYVFDSRAHAGAPLKGSRLGRWNGIAYYVLAGAALGVRHLGSPSPAVMLLHLGGWLLALSTLVSMLTRLRKRR